MDQRCWFFPFLHTTDCDKLGENKPHGIINIEKAVKDNIFISFYCNICSCLEPSTYPFFSVQAFFTMLLVWIHTTLGYHFIRHICRDVQMWYFYFLKFIVPQHFCKIDLKTSFILKATITHVRLCSDKRGRFATPRWGAVGEGSLSPSSGRSARWQSAVT